MARLKNNLNLIILITTLGSFTYGFNSSIMGTVFGLASFYVYFALDTTGSGASYANSILGATNGLYAAGGIIGCIIVPTLADRLGRKRTIQVVCAVCVISAVLQAAAIHVAMLLVGRLLNGIGAGMMNVVVPTLQSELSPSHRRGRLVGLHGFLLVTGYALAGWTGLGCYFESNTTVQWRLPLGLQTVAPGTLLLISPLLIESPRWFIEQDRGEEALIVLRQLRQSSTHEAVTEEAVQQDYHEIFEQLKLERSLHKSLWQSFKDPTDRRRLLSALFVQCLAQSTGVLVINNYQVLLYNGLGLFGYLPLLLYAVYASWAAVLNLVGALVVDRIGRIKMLTIGVVGCALSVAVETGLVARFSGTDDKVGNGFAVFVLFVFVSFYATCVDPISYVYCSEIFPTHLRARGVAVSVVGLFSMTLVYTQSAPTAFAEVGWKFYLLFIIVPLLGAPVLWIYMPETKGLSLEKIGVLFGDAVVDENGEKVESIKEIREEFADKSHFHLEGAAYLQAL